MFATAPLQFLPRRKVLHSLYSAFLFMESNDSTGSSLYEISLISVCKTVCKSDKRENFLVDVFPYYIYSFQIKENK